MATLHVMVGPPASGKTTTANKLSNLNPNPSIVVSSDKIREELYGSEDIQGNPLKVFSTVQNRIIKALAEGYDVYFDAINTKVRQLKNNLESIKTEIKRTANIDIQTYGYFMHTALDVCIYANSLRERHVPENVIEKYKYQMFVQEERLQQLFDDYSIFTVSYEDLNAQKDREGMDLY